MGVILKTKIEYLSKIIFFFQKLVNYLFQYFSSTFIMQRFFPDYFFIFSLVCKSHFIWNFIPFHRRAAKLQVF